MKKLKVVQIGCGKMSQYSMRYVFEKGGEIVAGFDVNEERIGNDISTIIGGEEKGAKVYNVSDLAEKLKELKPDVAMVTTMSLLNDIYDVFKVCAECSVNAISICEEAFYPQNSNPKKWAELNELAIKNNVTLTGTGYQDFSWGTLVSSICGTTHTIKKIKGKSSYNVEDYGLALAKGHGAGLTLEEFDKEIASADRMTEEERKAIIESGEFAPSYMWSVNGWLCSKLGLTVTSQEQKCVPQTHEKELHSTTLNMTIKKGDATGMSAVVTTYTAEGIVLETECIGKVYSAEEFDQNEWTVEGEPTTTVVINKPATVEMTCASLVNRLNDVVNAPAGFVTTDKLDDLKFKLKI